MTSRPKSGSRTRPGYRCGIVVAILIALLSAAPHLGCAIAAAAPAGSPDAVERVAAPSHPAAHPPAWDDCCAHDRNLVQVSALPADPAEHWLLGLLCWVVTAAVVLAARFPAAAAGRGPPGSPPFTRTGRQILTHLGIARR
ncbi:hypothetical protein [Nocardia nova]|uniref:hypothetical protein n=1 Tax=Nocardia nova TaxID=37330 RepID=UPI0034031D76